MSDAQAAKKPVFDPEARYVGEDFLEYRNFADFLRQKPFDSHRNWWIRDRRAKGHSEAALKAWAEGYDGKGPSNVLDSKAYVQWREGKEQRDRDVPARAGPFAATY